MSNLTDQLAQCAHKIEKAIRNLPSNNPSYMEWRWRGEKPVLFEMKLPGEAYRPDDYNHGAEIANKIIMREWNARQKA